MVLVVATLTVPALGPVSEMLRLGVGFTVTTAVSEDAAGTGVPGRTRVTDGAMPTPIFVTSAVGSFAKALSTLITAIESSSRRGRYITMPSAVTSPAMPKSFAAAEKANVPCSEKSSREGLKLKKSTTF